MLDYKRVKKLNKIKYKCLDIALYPIRCICTPIYNSYEKHRKNKRYSYKTILKLVQYCIDYHLNYDDVIYIVFDDYIGEEAADYGCYGYSSLKDISWKYRKVKEKITHVYHYQKEEYIKAVRELCKNILSNEEKENEFSRTIDDGMSYLVMAYFRIQDKEVCKVEN